MTGPVNDLAVIREKGKAVLEQVEQGGIRIRPLITHIRPFEELGQAFEQLLQHPEKQIKVIFKW